MDERLRHFAESLLTQADQAVDASANGLFDREDLVHLVSKFRVLTREVINADSKTEIEKEDMARRLHRTPPPMDMPVIYPPN